LGLGEHRESGGCNDALVQTAVASEKYVIWVSVVRVAPNAADIVVSDTHIRRIGHHRNLIPKTKFIPHVMILQIIVNQLQFALEPINDVHASALRLLVDVLSHDPLTIIAKVPLIEMGKRDNLSTVPSQNSSDHFNHCVPSSPVPS